jgi:hypothetical protein
MISREELRVTTASNADGFHVIAVFLKGEKINAHYYRSSVLAKLSKIARQLSNDTRRKMIISADSARPQSAKPTTEFCAKLDLTMASRLLIRRNHGRLTFSLF